MPPTLSPALTLRVYFAINDILNLHAVKGGPQRMVLPVVRGFLRGKDIDADLVPGGADYLLLDPETQTAHIDTRCAFRTSTQQAIYVRYEGVLKVDSKSLGPMGYDANPKSTTFGEHEWFVNPVLETNDPEIKAWAESSSFVGEGRWVAESGEVGVEYAIYRVEASKPE